MKVIVKHLHHKMYKVVIQQGSQSFALDIGWGVEANKAECQWFAKMFRLALKKHDAEKQKT